MQMNAVCLVASGAAILGSVICSGLTISSTSKHISRMESEFHHLNGVSSGVAITNLGNYVDDNFSKLWASVLNMNMSISNLATRIEGDPLDGLISPDVKAFSTITTRSGKFFILFENCEPYLDGYRVKASIGNPYFATFQGADLTCNFGPSYTNWAKVHIENPLSPSSWTPFEITLAPALPTEIKLLHFEMTIQTIRMIKPN